MSSPAVLPHEDPAATLPQRLRTLTAEHLSLAPAELHADALLTDDLGLDSLAAIEWGMTIEDTFAITLPETAWEGVSTYGMVEDLVAQLVVGQV